jgi:hypothetical protein
MLRCKDDTKLDTKEMRCENVNWIPLARDGVSGELFGRQ